MKYLEQFVMNVLVFILRGRQILVLIFFIKFQTKENLQRKNDSFIFMGKYSL